MKKVRKRLKASQEAPPVSTMSEVELHSLGRLGYRHLKCYDHLSCPAAWGLEQCYPGLLGLSAQANLVVARNLANTVREGLLALDLEESVRRRVESWSPEDLHELFLGTEEILDGLLEEDLPPWHDEDLTAELERWLENSPFEGSFDEKSSRRDPWIL